MGKQRAKSEEQTAKSKERRAKSEEQEALRSKPYALSPMPHALRSKPYAIASILCVFSIVGLVLIQVQIDMNRIPAYAGRQRLEEKLIYIPAGRFIKTVSLGFHVVLADLLWTRAVLYFGEHFTTDRVYRWLYDILDAVTTLDPNNILAYRFGGNLLSLEARDVEGSIALLEKGIRNNPDEDWRLYFSLGFNYFYYLEDYETAAMYLERASRLPGHPSYLPRLTARMYARGEKMDTAIEFLEEIYQQHNNERVKAVIADRINILVAKRHIRLLQDSVEKYKEVHGEYPRKLEELTQIGLLKELPPVNTGGGHYVIDPDTGMIDWVSESGPQWP